MNKIKDFGDLASCYANKNKSKIMCKNINSLKMEELIKTLQCAIVKKTKYLGIDITMKNTDLFKNDYEKLWMQLDKDIIKWKNLNLSLFGRIPLIKMNLLPRIIFYLQTILINKQTKQWENRQMKVMNFIWAGKRPRVKMKILMDDRGRGGLQVPNFKIYQEAIAMYVQKNGW